MLSPNKPLTGRDPESVWQERQRRQADASRICDSPDIRTQPTSRGTLLFLNRGLGGGGTSLTKLILKDASAADYLVCRPWNSNYWHSRRDLRQELGHAPTNAQIAERMAETDPDVTEDTLTAYLAKEIIVAKPPELRADDLDGYEIDLEVEAWDGATLTSSTKTISYDYKSATLRVATNETDDVPDETEIIVPRYIPEESVIHAIESSTMEMTVSGKSVTLLDANTASRAWMMAT